MLVQGVPEDRQANFGLGRSRVYESLERPSLLECHVPTLLTEGEDPEFRPVCELALFALGDSSWNGRWLLDRQEAQKLLTLIDAFSGSQDKAISLDEIARFVQNSENHQHVVDMPSAVHGILMEDLVSYAFQVFDRDGSGSLSKLEWVEFLEALRHQHILYLQRKAFQQFRAFYGRNYSVREVLPSSKRTLQPDYAEEEVLLALLQEAPHSVRSLGTFQIGIDPDCARAGSRCSIIPPGWLADLYYYSANNHPLHGILACDPKNLLTRFERVAMEFATLCFSLITSRLMEKWVKHQQAPSELLTDPNMFSLLVITIPSMIMFYVLLMLFTCPVLGHVNTAAEGRDRLLRARRCSVLGAVVAYVLIVIGFSVTAWRMDRCFREGCRFWPHFEKVIVARLRAYGIAWLLMVGIYFNPLIAWGQPDPNGSCNFGDYVGLGQWRIEKQRFQLRCNNNLQELHAKPRTRGETWASCGAGTLGTCGVQ